MMTLPSESIKLLRYQLRRSNRVYKNNCNMGKLLIMAVDDKHVGLNMGGGVGGCLGGGRGWFKFAGGWWGGSEITGYIRSE